MAGEPARFRAAGCTPSCDGIRPVRNAARVGEKTRWRLKARMKRTLPSESGSMLGARVSLLPCQPGVHVPCLSVRMTTGFVGLACGYAARKSKRGEEELFRHSRRQILGAYQADAWKWRFAGWCAIAYEYAIRVVNNKCQIMTTVLNEVCIARWPPPRADAVR
jgi:hypothetical protein